MKRTDVDAVIGFVNRFHIGYLLFIEYELEEGMDERRILEDIERIVERFFNVEDVGETARLLLNRIKEKNNY